MDGYYEFYDFMCEYTAFFEEVSSKEEAKMKALLANDIDKLELAISEHQSTTMRVEQYEKRRGELQEKLGLGSLKFKEIVDMLSGEQRARMKELYTRFEIAVHNTKHYNGRSLEIALMNLRIMDSMGMGSIKVTPVSGCYTPAGSPEPTYSQNVAVLDKKA